MLHEAEARDADGNLIAWASAGIVRSKLAGGDDWGGGDRADPEEERAKQVAARVKIHWEAPGPARMLRIPPPSAEDLEVLWTDWPSICQAQVLPSAEEWGRGRTPPPAPEGPPAGGGMATLVEWVRDRLPAAAEWEDAQ